MKTRARADLEKLRSSPVKLNGVIPVSIEATTPNNTNNNNIRKSSVHGDSSPVRRKKNIAKKQEERMQFIAKALNGYNDDLEKLFLVGTWKTLIKNAKKGTPDEKKFTKDSAQQGLAKLIIEQITTNEYSVKVGQVLSAPPTTRRGRASPTNSERATKFMMLALDFDKKQEDKVWKRAIGEDVDTEEEEEDSRGSEISAISCNEEECNNNNNHNSTLPLTATENGCVMMELEVEGEKENASHTKRQTRNSIKATQQQQSPLRVKSSQTLDNCRTNGWPSSSSSYGGGKSRQSTTTTSMSYQATISISKDNFEYSRSTSSVIDETFEIKTTTTTTSRSPMLLHGSGADDEVIENDTPPPTPINGILDHEPSSIPKKRTRFNSSSREFERPPSFGRFRGYGGIGLRQHEISTSNFRSMEFDDSYSSGLRSGSRGMMGDSSGPIEKFNGYEYVDSAVGSSSSSSISTVVHDKDFSHHDDLPDLEPPDTGRDKENLPKSEQEISRDYPRPLSCPELNFRMFEDIEEALSRPKKDKIVSAFGLTLMQEQLAVYNKSEWLEDANIDFYLEMIKHRNNREGSPYPSVYIFQSYFYKLLDKRGYESVQGATTKDTQDNIFQYDLVLIPIHSDHHWVLVVVDFNVKSMQCYDSMDHDNDKHLRIIAGYLKREYKELKLAKITNGGRNPSSTLVNLVPTGDSVGDELWGSYLGDEWTIKSLGADDIPQQKNGRDCGVFCLQFAEYLSRRQSFDFEQKHTAYFRKRMLYETLRKSLLIS